MKNPTRTDGDKASKAKVFVREKRTDEQGNLYDMVVWNVPVIPQYPDGIRYRLAFIRAGEQRPAVLYDNHHPKGHHRHLEKVEQAYGFLDPYRLIADFLRDASIAKGEK